MNEWMNEPNTWIMVMISTTDIELWLTGVALSGIIAKLVE